ncbi:MAG: TonB-dependent receptor [Alphaproteobacteria bacterium]|nr:TonB-dependent receptor [Alphaproteobacteria bacterium]MBU0792388.1 TonB-dependent receptor [Alphaproteobacteria bacterium]MBU0877153.1 TonB-dependent receptor [Alphaproteobacteria bacterium]MBU1770727.1 TonB-dependent receptor [Alphaproteobacteria bacterium]
MLRLKTKCSSVSALALALASLSLMTPLSPAQAASARMFNFSIPAGDLASALRQYSRVTGISVAAAPEVLRGRRSPGLQGTFASDVALAKIVAGAGVDTRVRGRTIIVTAQEAALAPASAQQTAVAVPAQALNAPQSEAVVVTGYFEAVQASLDKKRKADVISDTVSADDMGKLPANNVSEALARMPGVNAVRSATTGEGDRITVRGLSTELNNYSINGVRLGGAGSRDDVFYRGVRLSVLPPDGIKEITVFKTLTPDRDGDALGGSVDISTPTAFDQKPTYFRVSAEGGMLDKFDDRKSAQLSAAASRQFSDKFGIFVSASWSRRKSQFEQNGVDGDNQPDSWYANSETLGWDPNRFVLRGMNLAFGETEVERWGINSSTDFRSDNHDLHLRGQYNKYRKKEFLNRLNFRNDTTRNSTRLSQVDRNDAGLIQPEDNIVGFDDALGRIYGYTPDQIVDRDGDGLITDADRSARSTYSLVGNSGTWDPQGFRLRRFWEGSNETGSLASANFGGVSRFSAVTIDYDLSYSQSEDNLDDGYELEFRGDKYGWLGNKGVLFSASEDSRFPKWILNDAGLAGVQNPAEYNFSGLEGEVGGSSEKLWQAQFNLEWKPGGLWLDSIKTGAKFFNSRRRTYEGSFLDLNADGTLADFSSLYGKEITSLFSGAYTGVYRLGTTLDNEAMLAELRRAESGESSLFDGFAVDPSQATLSDEDSFRFEEQVVSGYVMGTMRFGRAQVIAGVRMEHTSNTIEAWNIDPVTGPRYAEDTSSFTNWLPSIHMNYEIDTQTKLRGAVWTSFARPDIARMSSAREYSYDRDPDGNGVQNPTSEWILTGISMGNPNLKPLRSTNLDLSLEHYSGRAGAYSAAVFYKRIENFLFRSSSSNIRNGTTGMNVGPEGVVVTMPNNGRWADVYGIEISGQQLLHWLPGVFGSLGIGGNLTLQRSKAETGLSWHPEGYTLPLMETPETIANLQLFWERDGWEVYGAWNYQSRFMAGINDFGNDPYEQGYSFVDLTFRKSILKASSVQLQVKNLFDSHTYWQTVSQSDGASRAYIKNGRSISLGINLIF